MAGQSLMRVGALACAGALVLGGCGGGSSKSSPTKSNTQAPAGSGGGGGGGGSSISSDAACKLIDQSKATALFGSPATQEADSSPVQIAKSVCLWNAKPTGTLSYLLQIRVYDKEAFYSGALPGYQPLAGVGDKAVIYVLPGGSTVMMSIVTGGRVVAISYGVHEITSGTRKSAEAQKDQLIALVKQSLGG